MTQPSSGPRPVDPFLLRQLAQETEARAAVAEAPVSDAEGAPDDVLAAIAEAVEGLAAQLLEASHDLAAHPEVSFEEHRSAEAMAALIESHGLEVTRAAYGLDTALRAEVAFGDGPTIAVLSEYDALPGIGHALRAQRHRDRGARRLPRPGRRARPACPAGSSGSAPRPRRAAAARS